MLCQGFPSILKFLFFLKFYLILFDMFLYFVSFNLTGSLHAHFGFQLTVFMGFLSVWMRGLCFSCLLFICFVLSQCVGLGSILLYYTVILTLRSPSVFRWDRKGVDLDWREVGRNGRGDHMQGTLFRKKIFSKKGKESLTFHNQTCTNNFMQPVPLVKGVFTLEIHLIKTRTGMTSVVLFVDCSGEDSHMKCRLGSKSGVRNHRLHSGGQSLRCCQVIKISQKI